MLTHNDRYITMARPLPQPQVPCLLADLDGSSIRVCK
jgi:hypothetical protein